MGALGGLASDADWIWAVDAEKGTLLSFSTSRSARFHHPSLAVSTASANAVSRARALLAPAAHPSACARRARPLAEVVQCDDAAQARAAAARLVTSSAQANTPHAASELSDGSSGRGDPSYTRRDGGVARHAASERSLGPEEAIVERYRLEVEARRAASRAETGETKAEQDAARQALIAVQVEQLRASWRRQSGQLEWTSAIRRAYTGAQY